MNIKSKFLKCHTSAGFTLIEIMVVVAVLGILASLAIPIYKGSLENAVRQEAYQALGALRESEQRYYAANASYTPTIANLDYNPSLSSSVAAGAVRHFNYAVTVGTSTAFTATATRNTNTAPGVTTGTAGTAGGYTLTITEAAGVAIAETTANWATPQ